MTMLKLLVLCIVLVSVLNGAACTRTAAQRSSRKFRHFEDYLASVTAPRAENAVIKPQAESDDSDESDEETSESSETEAGSTTVKDADILGYFRDVPREHWSCCMLGKLAGDKGFHCQVNFYATRIARRNSNRAQTRRMLFHGPNPVVNWGRELMTTFSRCIQDHATQFHDCCYTTTIEKRERRRWQQYRQAEKQPATDS